MRDFLSGMVWGGLVGAAVGLLMAPRSGDETLTLLRERGEEFRSQARETLENTKTRAEAVQERGRELIEENTERIKRTADAARSAVKENWPEPQANAAPGMASTGTGSTPSVNWPPR